ncbi:MAG: DUF3160 domain-containing protein [Verrucomicrobia bacterium]|nr:DUF3160 domain-containing protein [Verrucomicrobiota bacterium]
MKTRFLFSVAFCGLSISVSSADTITLQVSNISAPAQVGIHSQMVLPVSSMYPEYTILRSTNLVNWEPVAGPISGSVGVSDEFLRQAVPLAGNQAFYRVVAEVKFASPDTSVGDSIYGYGTEFGRQLQAVGQLPLSEFVSRYTPTNQYLSQISFDPTTADYWNDFNARGFGLDTNEFPIFQTNGFVVSGRLGTYSFADSFYKVFISDMPVFFSCDAALHAWHRSYMAMLEEVEEVFLATRLQSILQGMGGQVASLYSQSAGTALSDGVLDADYFIAVGRSLVTGTNNYGSLGQRARVLAALTAITNLQPVDFNLFGTNRQVDFSQFQVRGHYESSQRLQRYFRAMTWCGQIDFRFTGSTNDNSLRELAGSVAMHLLLNNSGQFNNWKLMDDVVQMFVGVPDSLNFAQLCDLMTAAGVVSPANLPNRAALQELQSNLMTGQLGVQQIQSGYFFSPLSRQQIKLPRSFTMLGQRFVPDAWAMGQCVFDKIIWDEDGIPSFSDKVMRRVPSALDIAFSVFGNDQTVPDLASRIANPSGLPWRDGYPYQHNLAAARRVMDLQDPSIWTNNIYYCWLACLRELSAPTTGPEYPDALRTRAWGMKTLNTQLASWTQLRHDTVLYVKQPYTGDIVCSYPDGFIEPRVSFWERMRDLALRTKALVATLPKTGQFVFEPNDAGSTAFTNSIGAICTNRIDFLDNFAANMTTLRDISVKELSRQPLSTNEVFFIQDLIENPYLYGGGIRTFSGWYPALCYMNARAAHGGWYTSSDIWDALVTDVHTDPIAPLVGDPGCILHEGVGAVQLLMVAVNWGPGDAGVYAGPVMSHYEFQLGPTTRRTDSEWKSQIRAGNAPPTPEWTRSHWVPGTFTFPWWIH